MPDRFSPVFKVVCLALGLLLVVQAVRLMRPRDPLASAPLSLAGFDPVAVTQSFAQTNAPARAGAKTSTNLPPVIQARVERITQSEILGPVVRPLPMALLGIAGNHAFIRTPNGQSGVLKEGEELGGVKLLRIGTNRVLIEHEQQEKELTLFAGLGSETLLEKSPKK